MLTEVRIISFFLGRCGMTLIDKGISTPFNTYSSVNSLNVIDYIRQFSGLGYSAPLINVLARGSPTAAGSMR